MYRVNVTPVVGLPQFSGWSQVVSSNFSSSQLVCAFAISGDHAGNAGRDFTEKISTAKADSPLELQQLIDELVSSAKELGAEIQLACGVFSSNRVILGTIGGSVFLKRSERTGVLLSSVDQVKIVEGKRVGGDVVVLVTNQATNFISEIKQKFISGFDTDSVVTSIIPGLHGLNNSSLSSIAFVVGGSQLDEDILEEDEVVDSDQGVAPPTLDIPPALKLRGAGKNRVESDGELSELGQIDQEKLSLTLIIKIRQKLSFLSKRFLSFFKNIDWRSIWIKITRLLSQLKNAFLVGARSIIIIFRKVTAKDTYLKTNSPQKIKKIVISIGIGIVIVGGLIGFRAYGIKKQVERVELVLSPVIGQVDIAQDQLLSDPISARESVAQAIVQLEQLEKDFSNQKKAQQLVITQLTSARELYDQISGQEEFGQLETFYDLRLVDNEFVVSALDATQQQVAFLDAGKKKIVLLDLDSKQVEQFDLSDLDRLDDLELADPAVTVLGKGVLVNDIEDKSGGFEEIIAEGDSNRGATLIESFATYIYILNPEKRNIYRYAKQKDAYSDPIGWVSGAAGFDYNQVSSWAIDGDVWVATRDGGLHKLASGKEQEFEVTGLMEPLTQALQVFTNEDLENLYVLEPAGKRLVVLNKKGEFLKEIKSDSLTSTTTLFVSEKMGKMFAVSGSIVYAMSI